MASDKAAHIPVLTDSLLEILAPENDRIIVDCTVGMGGHAKAILGKAGPGAKLIGLDFDLSALALAKNNLAQYSDRVTFVKANFANISQVLSDLKIPSVDLVYADLGLSSMQLADRNRGFSFREDGPLDMRMDPEIPRNAANLVNSLREQELSDIIFQNGEERKSKKIAKLICQIRRRHRIDSAAELAEIVCHALGMSSDKLSRHRIHPATKTFQALRIAVNNELDNLQRLLESISEVLKSGGKFAVISFHSLEDRIVKSDFREKSKAGVYRLLTSKPVTAGATEVLRNPRSRSAKLRAVQKVS